MQRTRSDQLTSSRNSWPYHLIVMLMLLDKWMQRTRSEELTSNRNSWRNHFIVMLMLRTSDAAETLGPADQPAVETRGIFIFLYCTADNVVIREQRRDCCNIFISLVPVYCFLCFNPTGTVICWFFHRSNQILFCAMVTLINDSFWEYKYIFFRSELNKTTHDRGIAEEKARLLLARWSEVSRSFLFLSIQYSGQK